MSEPTPALVSAQAPSRSARSVPSSPSPWSRSPFRWTRRDASQLPVQVSGTLPSWLRGTLMCTTPCIFEGPSWQAQHWFDGLALHYAFRFVGGALEFRQRLLDSDTAADAQRERQKVISFATSTKRRWYERLTRPIPAVTDNTNVNVVPWQGSWLSMTESPFQHVIDGESLASRGLARYADALPKGLAMTAHPHFDFTRKALVNVGTNLGPKSEILVYRQGFDDKERVVEGRLALKRVPYLHSFGLTPTRAVVMDLPLKVNPLDLLFTNRGFIDHFTWNEGEGTRLLVMDRQTGTWTEHSLPSFFCFHIVNAFDHGNELFVDMVVFDDTKIIQAFSAARLAQGYPTLSPRYVRAHVRPGRSQATLEPLSDQHFDLPAISYRRESGQPYSTAWGAHFVPSASGDWESTLVRVTPGAAKATRFHEAGMVYGGPIFVPRPGAERADDGVILTVGCHLREERTSLVVLEPHSLEPLARCAVEISLPVGFHGSFASQKA